MEKHHHAKYPRKDKGAAAFLVIAVSVYSIPLSSQNTFTITYYSSRMPREVGQQLRYIFTHLTECLREEGISLSLSLWGYPVPLSWDNRSSWFRIGSGCSQGAPLMHQQDSTTTDLQAPPPQEKHRKYIKRLQWVCIFKWVGHEITGTGHPLTFYIKNWLSFSLPF